MGEDLPRHPRTTSRRSWHDNLQRDNNRCFVQSRSPTGCGNQSRSSDDLLFQRRLGRVESTPDRAACPAIRRIPDLPVCVPRPPGRPARRFRRGVPNRMASKVWPARCPRHLHRPSAAVGGRRADRGGCGCGGPRDTRVRLVGCSPRP